MTTAEQRYVDGHLAYQFDPSDGVAGLVAVMREIQALPTEMVAFSLHLNIVLLLQWIEANPVEASRWLFGESAARHRSTLKLHGSRSLRHCFHGDGLQPPHPSHRPRHDTRDFLPGRLTCAHQTGSSPARQPAQPS